MTNITNNIAKKVITWKEVKQYINSGELYMLRRSELQNTDYQIHKKKFVNVDMAQFMLDKLGWKSEELQKLNDIVYNTDEKRINGAFKDKSLFKLAVNDFPYYFEPDVIHVLIWSKIKLPIYKTDKKTSDVKIGDPNNNFPEFNKPMKKVIASFLKHTITDKYCITEENYCWFINYVNLQSIQAVSHIHLIIKLPAKYKGNHEAFFQELKGGFEPLP
ncbi:Htc1p NDAI_0E02870 [Naumovozyma dairenensis CBS 421]|uniref:Uncharacterized protein n=1 Tax=Naumovozyma dairenensis (strain ATCC 10597 / BCRC 20456 / CBS 421 / NBRC 0211 / NRRL Y-12639) TaxID=1071378 RepID=G0WBI4_NAUDC|nr:hypothetical protein NDAI_0E02870 [Naumovozyma dairenensis CBS 421]CCD25104.1 hypothetical protein NDAI_0E02870 [Naumovozyma dairenensis CBS 421]